jgi:hypothetical protein
MGAGSEADILGYGGAAGGGKTDLLLGLAFNQHHRALILRREAAQLRDMIDRSTAIAPEGARFNGTLLSWRLDGARKVEFGGVKDAQDVAKWKGRPHDFLGFDEATEFSEGMVRFLMTWLRTTVAGQRRRAVLTFNPPTNAEGRWVLDFFAPWLDPKHHNPARPGELSVVRPGGRARNGEARWGALRARGQDDQAPVAHVHPRPPCRQPLPGQPRIQGHA